MAWARATFTPAQQEVLNDTGDHLEFKHYSALGCEDELQSQRNKLQVSLTAVSWRWWQIGGKCPQALLLPGEQVPHLWAPSADKGQAAWSAHIQWAFARPCGEGQRRQWQIHSSTLAWKIPWMEEPGRLQSMGSLRVGHDWATSLSRIGEGNGNPLQYSCLENPRDGGAWWAAVMGSHRVGHNWSDLAAAAVEREGGRWSELSAQEAPRPVTREADHKQTYMSGAGQS